MKNNLRQSSVFATLCFGLLFSFSVQAFKFSPMSQSIELDKDQRRAIFSLENDSSSPMAIQLKLKTRKMNEDGSEEQKELDKGDALTLFPEQVILPPGEKRSIRVSWKGDKPPAYEKAYRVIAEQLPIEMNKEDKDRPGIKMLLRYVAALYLTPSKASPNTKLNNSAITDERVELHLDNKGESHQLINLMSLQFKTGDKKKIIKASEVEGLSGENLLAKTKRIFKIPKTGPLAEIPEDAQVRIFFKE